MSKKKFTGVRKRVEGERAEHALREIAQRGYTVKYHGRLGDDTGYQIRTHQGPVINLYDTGSITVSGNNRHLFGDVDSLRMRDTGAGLLIVASDNDDDLARLSMKLRAWGIAPEYTLFGRVTWPEDVARARGSNSDVLVLISSTSSRESERFRHRAAPEVYFGLGTLVAQIPHGRLSVVHRDDIELPFVSTLVETKAFPFRLSTDELDDDLRRRLLGSGVPAGKHEAAKLF